MLGSISQGKLTLEEKHRFPNPNGRMKGHLQWDLLAQWEELKTGLRAADGSRGGQSEIHGIGVDTWGVDFGLIGRDGDVLGNPFHYRDPRTDGVMERTFRRVSRQKIFDITGLQFMQFNSLFQLLAMQEARSPALDAAETLLFMPDLFNYLFTGVRKAEFSIASTSQMMDPRTGTWADALLDELGLPRRILPPIVASGTVMAR